MTDEPLLICGEWSISWTSLYAAHMRLDAILVFTVNKFVAMKEVFENLMPW